jgi:ABC-2 type transport system ATP-binding protein
MKGDDVLLTFDKVKKSFGKRVVIEDASFYIKRGEIFGFVGKSGGGKSTLVKILLGISRSTGGVIYFGGKNVSRDLVELRRKVGFVSQGNSLFMELTLRENCRYFANLYSVKKDDFDFRFKQLVELLGFVGVEDMRLSVFSGGMIRRANILVSLIHNPEILILDEPTVGLDSILRDSLWKYVRDLNKKEGITIFLITHLLGEVDQNCSRVGILKNGRVVAFSDMKDYKERYGDVSFKEIFREIMRDESI